MNTDDIKICFKKWLIKQGCLEKTDKGRPSTVYEYMKRIDRLCDKFFGSHYRNEWEYIAKNIYPILALYLACQKKAHQKANISLDEIYNFLSEKDVINPIIKFLEHCETDVDIDKFLSWLWNEAKDNRKNKISLLKFYEFLRSTEYQEQNSNFSNGLDYDKISKNLSKITSPKDLMYIRIAQYANETTPKTIVPRLNCYEEEETELCIKDTADSLECSPKTLGRIRQSKQNSLDYCNSGYLCYEVDDVHQYLANHYHSSGYQYPFGTYNPKSKKNWCTAEEARKIIGCSKSTVIKYREDGELTYTDYTPRHVLYFIPDVERIRDERKIFRRRKSKKSKI